MSIGWGAGPGTALRQNQEARRARSRLSEARTNALPAAGTRPLHSRLILASCFLLLASCFWLLASGFLLLASCFWLLPPLLRVRERIRCRDEFPIGGVRNVRVPAPGELGEADDPEEDDRDGASDGPGRDGAGTARRQPQGAFSRANRDAFEAAGALGGLHRGEPVDRQQRGTDLRALRAVDADVSLTKTDPTSSPAITTAPVVPMRRKKFIIFTSATRP